MHLGNGGQNPGNVTQNAMKLEPWQKRSLTNQVACTPCSPQVNLTFNIRSIRVCPTGLIQNLKTFSAVLAYLESWSGSRLSLSIAVRCSQTTFSIMQKTDVKVMREMTWKCKSFCKCLEVWGGFPPFSSLSLDMWITALKHTASFLVSESNCKQSEQNPMSDSLCSREALSNALSVALERSIYTVGQHSAAFREWFHNVICNKPGMKCRWDKRMSTTNL